MRKQTLIWLVLIAAVLVAPLLLLRPGLSSLFKWQPPFPYDEPLSHWVAQLHDEDASRRERALDAVQILGREAKGAAAPLAAMLEDENPTIRRKAAKALWRVDQQAEPLLLESARGLSQAKEDPDAIGQVISDLASFFDYVPSSDHTDAVAALAQALANEKAEVRYVAAMALGLAPREQATAVPALTRALTDPAWGVRREVVRVLGRVGPGARAAAPALRQVLQDDTARSAHAAGIVGLLVSPTKLCTLRAVWTWEAAAWSTDALRMQAAWALCKVDRSHIGAAIPVILEGMRSYGEYVTNETVEILGMIGPEDQGVVPALLDALNGEDSAARLWAAQALGLIGEGARAAVPALRRALVSQDARISSAAAESLKKVDPNAASEAGVP